MTVPFPDAVERFPRVRQSWLATFDSCALSSKFEIDYGQGWSSHPAARGTIVHRTIARCTELMLEREESYVPVDVALEVLEDVIRQAPDEDAEFTEEVVSIPVRDIADARVTVKTWAIYTSYEPEDIAGVEHRLATTLGYPDGDGGVFEREVTGKLDLLLIPPGSEHARVIDYKDTWGIPSERDGAIVLNQDGAPANVSEEGYFQQRFYGLLVLRHYPRIQSVTLEETYVRYLSGKVKDRKGRLINPVRRATVTREELPDVVAEMSALVERFDRAHHTGLFRPAPGSHCAYCLRPSACTIFPTARGQGRISSADEAERYAGRLQVLNGESRQLTKALRTWSNAHGDVPVRDAKRPRVYGPVVREQKVTPTPEQIAEAVSQGRDVRELFDETREVVTFAIHSPEEQHPRAAEARREEEALLAMERAAENRRRSLAP